MEQYRAFLETWFKRVWEEQDLSAVDEMTLPEAQAKGFGARPISPEEFKRFHHCLSQQLTGFSFDIDHHFETEDSYSSVWALHAKRRDTGEPVTLSGHIYARLIDGRVVEAKQHVDFLELFECMGLFSKGTFARCLDGQKCT